MDIQNFIHIRVQFVVFVCVMIKKITAKRYISKREFSYLIKWDNLSWDLCLVIISVIRPSRLLGY